VRQRAWGVAATENGQRQVVRFCEFVRMHQAGKGVEEIARELGVHRSIVAEWRNGTDLPYLTKVALEMLSSPPPPSTKLLPLRVESGGNILTEWFRVPSVVGCYQDLAEVVERLVPEREAYLRSKWFGISMPELLTLRPEFAGYALGMMVSDAGKLGGSQTRLKSMNVDLQFTKGQKTNLRLGEFACMCFNLLGLSMHRIKDKPPSGTQLEGEVPTPAYRWTSNRTPLLAWIFQACLGLEFGQNTSRFPVRMDWLVDSPFAFRKRFLQAMGDSDGTVRKRVTEIASVPNAELVTKLMKSVGMASAYTRFENGAPLRSIVLNDEAASLPIFNEFAEGYRYQKLIEVLRKPESKKPCEEILVKARP
ncbi:MAG TPA: hypothetical protein VKF39_01435, partial [Nitrososphaerales archaeon]|nr:hypothetical protein [Nitrososphaerales archaeon]